ncbi:MAG: hypothetical protein IJM62_04415, partial [Lachnospiraceae bacterium]|nr:hypothetical protein [Lachnospiraceae bacterium]
KKESEGGGGSKGGSDVNGETVESIIEKTLEKAKDVKSVESEYKMDVKMLIKAAGVSADMAIYAEGTAEAVKDPQAAHVNMTMTIEIPFSGTQSQGIDMYTFEKDGKTVAYASYDDGQTWSETEPGNVNTAEEQATGGLQELKDAGVELTLEGKETFEGKECFVIKADIDAEDLKLLMEKTSGSYGESIDSLDQLVGEGVDITYHLYSYVDAETYEYRGFVIDMKDAMDAAMQVSVEQAKQQGVDMECITDKAEVKMIFKSYNTTDKIDIPDAIK